MFIQGKSNLSWKKTKNNREFSMLENNEGNLFGIMTKKYLQVKHKKLMQVFAHEQTFDN
jgi:hypothetical protein